MQTVCSAMKFTFTSKSRFWATTCKILLQNRVEQIKTARWHHWLCTVSEHQSPLAELTDFLLLSLSFDLIGQIYQQCQNGWNAPKNASIVSFEMIMDMKNYFWARVHHMMYNFDRRLSCMSAQHCFRWLGISLTLRPSQQNMYFLLQTCLCVLNTFRL